MGVIWSSIRHAFGMIEGDKEVRVLVLGLDNAGKTSILYHLQLGTVVQTVPTVGFNLETVVYKNITFQVWDLGGQTGIRPYWRCYFSQTDAIIYVVDSTDRDRMGVAKNELFALLEEEELRKAVILIFANKQDLRGAAGEAEIAQMLGLTSISSHTWAIMKSSAHTGVGLSEGMDWLCEKLKDNQTITGK
eukprot:Tbor_TRINITY_DN5010_c6_g2::TRINITY_DN5010_c6_g2_i2::g.14126::m.14126/K07942/ARL1; ADP-ribosylation factor-like protein 1